jgi:hypothetical protein
MGDGRRRHDNRLNVGSSQERRDVWLERTGSAAGFQERAPVIGIDGGRHEVSAADGVSKRAGVEATDPPQPDYSEPDARHRFSPKST